MARLTLKDTEDYSFTLLGIACHAKDYRLSWAINKALGIALERPPKNDNNPEDVFEQFSIHQFEDADNFLMYSLIANRGPNGLFAPDQKKVDYFLKIEGSLAEIRKKEILTELNKIDLVLAVYSLEPKQLRSKQNFLI
jgi:hypothetical protein